MKRMPGGHFCGSLPLTVDSLWPPYSAARKLQRLQNCFRCQQIYIYIYIYTYIHINISLSLDLHLHARQPWVWKSKHPLAPRFMYFVVEEWCPSLLLSSYHVSMLNSHELLKCCHLETFWISESALLLGSSQEPGSESWAPAEQSS